MSFEWKPGQDVTARSVLRCDECGHHIGPLSGGMLVWSTHRGECEASAVHVIHKGACDVHSESFSEELSSFASADWAMRRLMNLHRNYNFTAEQSRQLAYVAWAATVLSTDEEKAECAKRMLGLLNMGFGL